MTCEECSQEATNKVTGWASFGYRDILACEYHTRVIRSTEENDLMEIYGIEYIECIKPMFGLQYVSTKNGE